MGGTPVNGNSGAHRTSGVLAVDSQPTTGDVRRNFVEWSAQNQGAVRDWLGASPTRSQFLPLVGGETSTPTTPTFNDVSKVVHAGAGPIKGTIFVCIDDSYKGPGTAGNEEFIGELKSALDRTDFGKYYEVRLITTNDGLETLASNEGMLKPPNMSLVLHGDPAATNQRWNTAVGRQDFPFVTSGLAPGQFEQPVSVGPCASRAEYANPKLMALVSCHELGHRLFNMADGAEKGQRRTDGSTDHSGGWGDFHSVQNAQPGEPGSLNLMWDGGSMIEVFNRYAKEGKPLPDAAYKLPTVFLEGLGGKFGIQSYLDGLPRRS